VDVGIIYFYLLVEQMCICVYMCIIVNTTMSCVIKLHGKYVLFSVVLLGIGVIEHRRWCPPKGEGYVTSLVKIPSRS